MADIKGIELASDIYGLEDETARDNTETNTSAIGTLANLKTTVKTDLVAAINEVADKVPSRPIIKVTTTKSSMSNTSELTMSDVIAAGYTELRGSYLVTIYRDTTQSQSYFIGWSDAYNGRFSEVEFTKLAGMGNSLTLSGTTLVYSGGDSSEETTWIFNPIGDSHTDD